MGRGESNAASNLCFSYCIVNPGPPAELEIAALADRLRSDPRSLAFVRLADLLRRAGRQSEALQVVRKGLKHHPEHVSALVVLARVHLESGQRALALAVLEDCAGLDPDNAAAGTLLAELRMGDGRGGEARTILQRLLSSTPGDPELQRLWAKATPQPAAVHGDPNDPFDTQRWADLLVKRGQLSRGAAAWARLATFHPHDEGTVLRAAELAERARRGVPGPLGTSASPATTAARPVHGGGEHTRGHHSVPLIAPSGGVEE